MRQSGTTNLTTALMTFDDVLCLCFMFYDIHKHKIIDLIKNDGIQSAFKSFLIIIDTNSINNNLNAPTASTASTAPTAPTASTAQTAPTASTASTAPTALFSSCL